MSSTDFWEGDPQLYWAYRTFYLKQKEIEAEQIRYNAWLLGNMQSVAVSISLSNAFGKGKKNEFPSYEELFDNAPKKEKLSPKEAKDQVINDFNYWARR